jgi:hypothetical protein
MTTSSNDNDGASPTFKRALPISKAIWEQYREAITELYATKTLRDVSQHMARVYSFHATEQQYKRQIARWDIGKNVKGSEMKAIVAGHNTSRMVRGRRVPHSKVRRYQYRWQQREGTIQSASSPNDEVASWNQFSSSMALSGSRKNNDRARGVRHGPFYQQYLTPPTTIPDAAQQTSSLSPVHEQDAQWSCFLGDNENHDPGFNHNETLFRLLDVQRSDFQFDPEHPLAYYEFVNPNSGPMSREDDSSMFVANLIEHRTAWDGQFHQIIDQVMLHHEPMLQLAMAGASGTAEPSQFHLDIDQPAVQNTPFGHPGAC